MTDHYFTAQPASSAEVVPLTTTLAGRELTVRTAAGIFSPDGLDKGTAVLLADVPEPPAEGTFLDLGCGWGPIALTLALRSPAAQVWAVDVNERAMDLLRGSAADNSVTNLHVAAPDDVPEDVTFDLIWSNPPIRVGKAALHELLTRWLPRLAPQGQAYLVVGKNLGADSLVTWLNATFPELVTTRVSSSKGFRVLRVARR